MQSSGFIEVQLDPGWCVIRGFIHAAYIVIHTSIDHAGFEEFRNQQMIYTQTPPGFTFESAAAVIEPAETIGFVGVAQAKSVVQTESG